MSAHRKPPTGSQRKADKRGARSVQGRKKPLGRRILKWGLVAVLVGFLLGGAAFAYGYVSTDIPNPNEDFKTQTTIVYYQNGKKEIGRFATQNRISIPLSEVPDHVKNAVIAAEDRTFYTNQGIDPKGILRAAFSNAQGNATQGASTITQQYVKVFYLSQERTLTRKIREAFLSLKLQRTQSKNEILQGYLNTIYFGRGAYGIQAAAQAYFDKDAEDLSLREGAALAAILNSPGNLDPALSEENRERLEGRYGYVLKGMADEQMITANEAAEAKERLPEFAKQDDDRNMYGGQRGHMLTMVKKQLRAKGFSDAEIEGGGLRITTTFTRKAMHAATQAVKEQRPKGLKKLHVAVASVDPDNGALRGMYGGHNFLKSQINWASAGGQPGSAFKPFALSAGLKYGYSLESTFQGNSPYVFPNGNQVVNEGPGDGNDYGESISLLTATEESVNTAYIDMTVSMKDGPQKILDTAVDMGIPQDTPGLKPTSGISLGSATVSPIDMANAYGTLANGGVSHNWYVIDSVRSADGKVLYRESTKTERALDRPVARDASYGLQQVVREGTGANAQALGRPAAGKTGTATNADDAVSSSWFVGYTPYMATAVMYVRGDGNDNLSCVQATGPECTPGYLVPYFGAVYPTQTWTAVMEQIHRGVPVQQFPPPAHLEQRVDDEEHDPYTPPPEPEFTPEPEPEPTEEPEPTPSPTPTPTPTETSTPTPSPTPTPSDPCDGLVCDPSDDDGGPTPPPEERGNGDGPAARDPSEG
ncbi:MAG TPA: transglycosylase domain-containing protein [Nocardioidaceae bacterium]|nr:transglycosylase domain-containing protein [Nocardioidaceae bacterium]